MKRLINVILVVILPILMVAGCGEKQPAVSDETLRELQEQVQALKEQLENENDYEKLAEGEIDTTFQPNNEVDENAYEYFKPLVRYRFNLDINNSTQDAGEVVYLSYGAKYPYMEGDDNYKDLTYPTFNYKEVYLNNFYDVGYVTINDLEYYEYDIKITFTVSDDVYLLKFFQAEDIEYPSYIQVWYNDEEYSQYINLQVELDEQAEQYRIQEERKKAIEKAIETVKEYFESNYENYLDTYRYENIQSEFLEDDTIEVKMTAYTYEPDIAMVIYPGQTEYYLVANLNADGSTINSIDAEYIEYLDPISWMWDIYLNQ